MIRVLIVDDSSFMRKSLAAIVESDPSLQVADVAGDGAEAVQKTRELHPDVVLLDIEMPRMDGVTALMRIMSECPTAVVMLSALNKKDPAIAIKSLHYGAVDFIAKPSGVISYDIEEIKGEIVSKIKVAAGVDTRKLRFYRTPGPDDETGSDKPGERKEVVIIGASTGGPNAIAVILSGLPRNVPATILIAQHMSHEFVPSFVDRLRWECLLEISAAREGDVILSGRVLVLSCGYNMEIVQDGSVKRIRRMRMESGHGPASFIDHAMGSVALACGNGVLGVVLTGMGDDGAVGIKTIKRAGGWTIAEDFSTCLVDGMPRSAIATGCVDEVVPLPRIGQAILRRI
ncbi:MAG: chemotaxis-specific protein-glutamate methyltransferase CheB [Deltaproteobacteria bacterium]|nr:chemotaxis-specific protein-glutamate methyltransferase CheB [Deltaproteobacteria bacterium]